MTKKTIIAVSVIYAVILAVLIILVPIQRKKDFYDKWGQLAVLAETDENARYITEHEELYPDFVLDYYYKNPDELEFVRYYPELKDSYASMSYTEEELNGQVPALYMFDPRWAYEVIDNQFYIKENGCESVSLTMAYVGLTGRTDIDPIKITYIAADIGAIGIFGGITAEKTSELCEKIGLTSVEYDFVDANGQKVESADINEMKSILDKGHVILAGMIGDTFGNHALIITDYSGDDFTIHDPADSKKTAKKWKYNELDSQLHYMWDLSA